MKSVVFFFLGIDCRNSNFGSGGSLSLWHTNDHFSSFFFYGILMSILVVKLWKKCMSYVFGYIYIGYIGRKGLEHTQNITLQLKGLHTSQPFLPESAGTLLKSIFALK